MSEVCNCDPNLSICRRWGKLTVLPLATIVWPALFPPWALQTSFICGQRTSTNFPYSRHQLSISVGNKHWWHKPFPHRPVFDRSALYSSTVFCRHLTHWAPSTTVAIFLLQIFGFQIVGYYPSTKVNFEISIDRSKEPYSQLGLTLVCCGGFVLVNTHLNQRERISQARGVIKIWAPENGH